ncbi:hypothetical protein N7532_010167 [Penicillium argentinense]|uniref:Uncharacterized protein n=1 Tax=Penicillium argentinense TaxID=1131581 RepID=A0A9W9JXV3_9EURO|nr:uncharacterized protein N7532_010167 [Penicillium argentinense]KAJ5085396.1 hypothetical protein N7532_010167 [Penicillium argentinense]
MLAADSVGTISGKVDVGELLAPEDVTFILLELVEGIPLSEEAGVDDGVLEATIGVVKSVLDVVIEGVDGVVEELNEPDDVVEVAADEVDDTTSDSEVVEVDESSEVEVVHQKSVGEGKGVMVISRSKISGFSRFDEVPEDSFRAPRPRLMFEAKEREIGPAEHDHASMERTGAFQKKEENECGVENFQWFGKTSRETNVSSGQESMEN